MQDKYNLFNNEKVDELTSTFLEKKSYESNTMEKFIAELIQYYDLMDFCTDISFCEYNNQYLGLYNFNQRKICINYKRIIELLKSVSNDNYFILANVYRIILHEFKHILQHKMMQVKDYELFRLFFNEISIGANEGIKPSEVNAEIESSMVIIKNYNHGNSLYEKQFAFSIRLISSFFYPNKIVENYCIKNKIILPNIDKIDELLYGINDEILKIKKK